MEAIYDPTIRPALERELLGLGLRLSWLGDGTNRITYHDVYIILTEASESSPIARALHPEQYAWGLKEELLAGVIDQIQFARYEQSTGKGSKPKPIDRPSIRSDKNRKTNKVAPGSSQESHRLEKLEPIELTEGVHVSGQGEDPRNDIGGKYQGATSSSRELIKLFGLEDYYYKEDDPRRG